MLLSTSSSDEEEIALPTRVATKPLVAAVVAATVVLGGLELGWRRHGYAAMPRDTLQLWALERARVEDSRAVVAIIGSSRAQLGLDPQVIGSELHHPTHMLAITGGSPLPVLRDLAEDPNFRGLVICDVTPSAFFVRPDDISKQSGADWAAAWRGLPYVTSLETRLRIQVQLRSTLLLPQTNLRFQASSLLTSHALARPEVAVERADRYRAADYSKEDVQKTIDHWVKGLRASKVPDAAELAALEKLVAGWVTQIRAHGGDVVFVRLPSSFAVADTEEELWPRAHFWDAFMAAFDSKSIHYADYPELAHFTAPEGSHLDAKQAAPLSAAFAKILAARGWVR